MIAHLLHLCERGSGVLSALPPTERRDAERLLALCQCYAESADETPASPRVQLTGDDHLTRELTQLVEYLARRRARGIPLATLGRAVLAHRAGHLGAYVATCSETEQKLEFQGL